MFAAALPISRTAVVPLFRIGEKTYAYWQFRYWSIANEQRKAR